jgi:hypothetical protein
MEFSHARPAAMQRIDDAPFAQMLRSMFGVGVRQGDYLTRRHSIWTGSEIDDLPPDRRPAAPQPGAAQAPAKAAAPAVNHLFDAISPQIANLGLDYLRDPRHYVSLLLGGNENRWSNVDFAASFATAITGRPVIPHILPGTETKPGPARRVFPDVARRLRPGLEAVVGEGTAAFAKDDLFPPILRSIPGLEVYAKTGTLAVSEGDTTTSRLVLAFVVWQDKNAGIARKGIVFSIVGEHARTGDATRWLAAYISENADAIARELR